MAGTCRNHEWFSPTHGRGFLPGTGAAKCGIVLQAGTVTRCHRAVPRAASAGSQIPLSALKKGSDPAGGLWHFTWEFSLEKHSDFPLPQVQGDNAKAGPGFIIQEEPAPFLSPPGISSASPKTPDPPEAAAPNPCSGAWLGLIFPNVRVVPVPQGTSVPSFPEDHRAFCVVRGKTLQLKDLLQLWNPSKDTGESGKLHTQIAKGRGFLSGTSGEAEELRDKSLDVKFELKQRIAEWVGLGGP